MELNSQQVSVFEQIKDFIASDAGIGCGFFYTKNKFLWQDSKKTVCNKVSSIILLYLRGTMNSKITFILFCFLLLPLNNRHLPLVSLMAPWHTLLYL